VLSFRDLRAMQLHRQALSCFSARKYHETVELALKCLRLDPTFTDATTLIARSLLLILNPVIGEPSHPSRIHGPAV
jgi:hypothetical protein